MRTIVALLLAGSTGALAESSDPSTIALGFMTEQADAVLILSAGSETPGADGLTVSASFRVDEVLRGDVTAPLRVLRASTSPSWETGARYLAFLRQSDPGTWIPLHPTLGLRKLTDGEPGIPFPEVVREIAATLDPKGRVAQADRLRALLVQWMCDRDSGVSWSAATDFVRLTGLHEGLTPDQGAAIVAAYAREPVGKGTKKALALAVAVTRHSAAGDVLVDSLMLPSSRYMRTTVIDALTRLGDERVRTRIETDLEDAGEEQRVSLLAALGHLGGPAGLRAGRAYLSDPSPRVRPVAAHALGLSARMSRRSDPDTELEGRRELEVLLNNARTQDEIKASLWALAQLDQHEAYAVLRKTVVEDDREVARRYASRYLKSPRQSLILGRE